MPDITMARVSVDNGTIPFAQITADEAPALAAAILAAAGCEHHRVIDLGGEIPNGARTETGHVTAWGQTSDAITDEALRLEIRHNLSVLQARAAASQHDPAEVDAVAAVLNGMGVNLNALGMDTATATRRVLDALARVRGQVS